MNELICYCIEHMSAKDQIYTLFNNYSISYKKSDSYKQLSDRYRLCGKSIPMDKFTKYFRSNWKSSPVQLHLDNLQSGLLLGHSWHQAMPSMLHLSMQNKVRECIDGNLTLQELIEIGSDIMKHEYFMVATHDICESTILEYFKDSIPPIGNKSISDFVFMGIPYDLKVSTYPDSWDKENKYTEAEYIKKLATELYSGADKERMRKQAEKANSPWALNRFYIMVDNQNRWIDEPSQMLEELIAKVGMLTAPHTIVIHGEEILIQLIEL